MLTGILAFLVDCIIGDPKSKWHPGVLMGKLISLFERLFYHAEDKDSRKFAWGAVLVLLVLWLTYAVAEGIMLLSYRIPGSWGSTAVGAV
ncbi:MAG: cobalamin biosynthesis protein, partial [Selenomonas sp.]|nr:cobalamin biosynthesis protein [Selenomonas sp.]